MLGKATSLDMKPSIQYIAKWLIQVVDHAILKKIRT
jgi:hypothetical protein